MTRTAPTGGLGLVRPSAFFASDKAARMNSSSRSVIMMQANQQHVPGEIRTPNLLIRSFFLASFASVLRCSQLFSLFLEHDRVKDVKISKRIGSGINKKSD